MKAKKVTAALIPVAGLILAACSSSASGGTASHSHSPARVADGKPFTMYVNSDPGSLNPYTTTLASAVVIDQFLYGTLLAETATGTPLPELAAKWSATTTTATFTLRSGLTCSDGTKLTASDVAADINWVGNSKNGSSLLGQDVMAGTTAIGNDSAGVVTVKSGAPDPFLLANIGKLPIACKSGLADPKLLSAGKAGTGPYAISDAVAGDHYTAKLRKGFASGVGNWTSNTPGVPASVTAKVIRSASTAANLFLSGSLNYVYLDGSDAQRVAATHPFTVNQYSAQGLIYFNQTSGSPGADPIVRKALLMSLNLPQIGKVLGPGKSLNQISGADAVNLCPANTVDANIPPSDLSQAKKLLSNDGWTVGSDGIRVKNGVKLKMNFPFFTSPGNQTDAAELIQQQLKAVGAQIDLHASNGTQYEQSLKTGNWGMSMAGWGWSNPSNMVPFFSGKSWTNGGTNFTATDNPTYNSLVAKAKKVPGAAGCSLWNQAESALIKDLDIVPFYQLATSYFGHGATFSSVNFAFSIRMTA